MKRLVLQVAAAAIVLVCVASSTVADSQTTAPTKLESFDGAVGWLNSPPLSPADLRGKVVLVDFWEYTCINCLRTLPYLREWSRRYADKGLVIVGVHTPEFDFSGDQSNVEAAVKRLGVTWPVALDDHMTIWNRYGNAVWPHEYLFDQNGNLVEGFAGEGGYPQTETKIQALLKAGNPQLQLPHVMALLPQDSYDKPGAVCYPQTAELLVGRHPVANVTAFNDPSTDTHYAYSAGSPKDGALYLDGFWHMTQEAAVSGGSSGFAAIRYHAIQVVSVMKPERGGAIRVNVTQDGKPIAQQDAGKDIQYDGDGSYVTVDAARAYDLITNSRFGEYELRLAPKAYGLGIYSFAFESCEVPSGSQ